VHIITLCKVIIVMLLEYNNLEHEQSNNNAAGDLEYEAHVLIPCYLLTVDIIGL